MLTESWQRDHGRYIPQFSNFLRGQRWLDPLSREEEETNRNRLEAERMEFARKREQEADEARREEKRERLRPLYDSFAEKFGEAASQPNVGMDAMNFGMWMFLHGKYGGPTPEDVPDGNTLSVYDFMKAFQRQRDSESSHTARSVRDSLSDNRANRPVNCANIPRNNNFLARLIPAAQPLCAAV
jgi:flagellum-specific peptidoglycan hydrolase FlgJ